MDTNSESFPIFRYRLTKESLKEPEDWYDWLFKQIEHSESTYLDTEHRRERILILSGSKALDERTILEDTTLADVTKFKLDERRMTWFENNPFATRVSFSIIDLRKYSLMQPEESMNSLIKDIRQFVPTRIVFGFSSKRYENFKIIQELRKISLIDTSQIHGINFVIYPTRNIFENEIVMTF